MRLLYVVTEDWYFLLHRLPMALAAKSAGFDVHVATRLNDGADAIVRLGFTPHPIPFARASVSPLSSLKTIAALRSIERRLAPDIIHHVSLQTIVLGSIAALGLPGVRVNALTGLGDVFISNNPTARLLRRLGSPLIRFLLSRRGSVALVENPDDAQTLAALGIERGRIVHIAGSGVDVERLRPAPEPPGPLGIGFAGRLIERKGVRTVVEAHRLLRGRGSDARLLIAGTPDRDNPTATRQEDIAAWGREPGVTLLGHVTNIAELWARAAIAVLPSHGGEGVPMALLEAAACGRPMVATDVPGCREIVVPGKTGLLVPVNDAPALADAIETLARAPALRAQYGAAARELAVERFSADSVGRQVVDLYRSLGAGR